MSAFPDGNQQHRAILGLLPSIATKNIHHKVLHVPSDEPIILALYGSRTTDTIPPGQRSLFQERLIGKYAVNMYKTLTAAEMPQNALGCLLSAKRPITRENCHAGYPDLKVSPPLSLLSYCRYLQHCQVIYKKYLYSGDSISYY